MSDERSLVAWFRRTRATPRGEERRDVGRAARHPELVRLVQDLRRLGIRERIRFVWSGDGSGVEEDEPSVIHIMRSLVRADRAPASVHAAAERILALDVGSVARHEVGHALLFLRPAAARGRRFRRLFGEIHTAYRVGDPVEEVLRRMNRAGLANPRYRRVVSLYAATHPHERFAEAVRIALALRADEAALRDWAARHRTAPIVGEQLLWAARWLRRYGTSSTPSTPPPRDTLTTGNGAARPRMPIRRGETRRP